MPIHQDDLMLCGALTNYSDASPEAFIIGIGVLQSQV